MSRPLRVFASSAVLSSTFATPLFLICRAPSSPPTIPSSSFAAFLLCHPPAPGHKPGASLTGGSSRRRGQHPALETASPPARFAGQAGERRGREQAGWIRRSSAANDVGEESISHCRQGSSDKPANGAGKGEPSGTSRLNRRMTRKMAMSFAQALASHKPCR